MPKENYHAYACTVPDFAGEIRLPRPIRLSHWLQWDKEVNKEDGSTIENGWKTAQQLAVFNLTFDGKAINVKDYGEDPPFALAVWTTKVIDNHFLLYMRPDISPKKSENT